MGAIRERDNAGVIAKYVGNRMRIPRITSTGEVHQCRFFGQ
ncbi:MAG TPA: hypothetical protein VIB49_10740 [Thermoplasmata archaeon]|jgi:hypothetical protein